MPNAPTPVDSAPESDVGLRTFDELNATFAGMTGVSSTDSRVAATYELVKQALPAVEKLGKEMPEGTRIVFSGSATVFKESFQSLFFALFLGIIVAYMILASQFNSFVHPFTVLMAVPFAVTGALATLWLTGDTLNLMSMIGMVLFRLRNIHTWSVRRTLAAVACVVMIYPATLLPAIVSMIIACLILITVVVYETIRYREVRADARGLPTSTV